jgi:hypothetical protein
MKYSGKKNQRMVMMIFLEKIKPHLMSNDSLIQETVLRAIHDFPNLPEEWTIELLREAFKEKEKILMYIENQTFNEEAVKVMIDNIPKMDQFKIHLAIRLINCIEPEIALTYRKPLERYISKERWKLIELEVNGTMEEVCTEYEKALTALEQTEYHSYEPYSKAKKLAARIVKNGWITVEEIDRTIEENINEQWFSYKGILTIYMIGLLRLEKYIPLLANLLERDEDILLEEVRDALIRFQSDEVVKAVEPYLRKPESTIFATSVMENIKSDSAVRALREAYQYAEVSEDQDMLIEALCKQFSSEALPEISDHMKREHFSRHYDVEKTVYSYYSILGEQHSDLEKWRQTALKREMNGQTVNMQEMVQKGTVHKENKVGRNDPCPCGSGKKYKKCCGK